MRGLDAVGGIGAEHIKVAVAKGAAGLVEHLKRLGLVGFHRGDGLVEQRSRIVLGGVFARRLRGDSRRAEQNERRQRQSELVHHGDPYPGPWPGPKATNTL